MGTVEWTEKQANEWAEELFTAAQRPAAWLLSAERLRDAAEAILTQEDAFLGPYLHARDAAKKEVETAADGIAEIKAIPPNYPPAELLYAFAIENVLKGIIVHNNRALVDEQQINKQLESHKLVTLANDANFSIDTKERRVLQALSQLSVWAGRYPVAKRRNEYTTTNPHDLLDYGSLHSTMRTLFNRAREELEGKLLPRAENRLGGCIVRLDLNEG